MTRRVLRRGIAVFAPQLHVWGSAFGPEHQKEVIDRRLKQVGGSIAALDLHRVSRSLDYFEQHRDIDEDRIGMIGLSYGGFYTLYAAALDLRIRVGVSSCYVNNRLIHDFEEDWVWFNAANQFMDAEVGALICPRPLYVEVGVNDQLLGVRHARPEAKRLAAFYQRLGVPEAYHYEEHVGGHEVDKADGGIDFLCRHLGVEAVANKPVQRTADRRRRPRR